MSDPRSSGSYMRKARDYINARRLQPIDCALCGEPVQMQAPSTTPTGPTIEHTVPVRHLKRMAADRAELVALVCNTEWWAIAHRRCQDKQGAKAVNMRKKSRQW